MSPAQNVLWSQVVVPSLAWFGLAGSVLGIAVGLGLLLRSAATLRFLATMNNWVSTRRVLKPLEIPRSVGSPTGRKPRWNGLVLVLAGAYVSIVLWHLDGARLASAMAHGARYPVVTGILLNAMRWFMVAGGLTAVAVGVMLLFFPRAYPAIEARANHWYSTRRVITSGDGLHMTLDRWVEAHPRAAGTIIACLSVIAALAFAALIFSRRAG
jgi:hypothetical protein